MWCWLAVTKRVLTTSWTAFPTSRKLTTSKAVHSCEVRGLQQAFLTVRVWTYFFNNIYFARVIQLRESFPNQCWIKRELLPYLRERLNKPSGKTLTLTNVSQSLILAFPVFNTIKTRGIFFSPFRWHCMASIVLILSGLLKQSIASWRAVMTGIESDGRRNHWRRRLRPSVVRVVFRVPAGYSESMSGTVWKGRTKPKRERPSFVLSECVEAWLSSSNICRDLWCVVSFCRRDDRD